MGKARNRSYKELTLQQLRCFFETVRLGSFTAAASALGVSHPTVLQQVRALERQFGAKLVEPHERGCSLTGAGRLLMELAGPSVEAIDTPFAARASFVASIRRFVALGLGIGLIPSVPTAPPHPGFFERSMSEHFGHVTIHLVCRRGAFVIPAGEAFIRAVRERLGAGPTAET